ncbi:hypothetical protein FRC09_013952, partial [Ceratobasidium sp. 395]
MADLIKKWLFGKLPGGTTRLVKIDEAGTSRRENGPMMGLHHQLVANSSLKNDDYEPIERVQDDIELNRPKSKGVLGEGTDFDTTECKYFVVNGAIYGYDMSCVVYYIDDQYRMIPSAELSPNPPIPNTDFALNGVLFKIGYDLNLLRRASLGWVQEQIYETVAEAYTPAIYIYHARDHGNTPVQVLNNVHSGCMPLRRSFESAPILGSSSLRQGSESGVPKKSSPESSRPGLLRSMEGLSPQRVQPATPPPSLNGSTSYVPPAPEQGGSWGYDSASLFHRAKQPTALQPHWLLFGNTPGKQEVDELVQAMKSKRRQPDHGEAPPLKCPLPACKHIRELRRPQALR